MSDGTTAGMISGRDLMQEMDRKRQVRPTVRCGLEGTAL